MQKNKKECIYCGKSEGVFNGRVCGYCTRLMNDMVRNGWDREEVKVKFSYGFSKEDKVRYWSMRLDKAWANLGAV